MLSELLSSSATFCRTNILAHIFELPLLIVFWFPCLKVDVFLLFDLVYFPDILEIKVNISIILQLGIIWVNNHLANSARKDDFIDMDFSRRIQI